MAVPSGRMTASRHHLLRVRPAPPHSWPGLLLECGYQPVGGTDGPTLLPASASLPFGRKHLLGSCPPRFAGRKLRHSIGGSLQVLSPVFSGLNVTQMGTLWASYVYLFTGYLLSALNPALRELQAGGQIQTDTPILQGHSRAQRKGGTRICSPSGVRDDRTPAPPPPNTDGSVGWLVARLGRDKGSEVLTPKPPQHVRSKRPWEPLSHLSRTRW